MTIVGVTPQDFSGIQTLQDPGADVTLPLALDPQLNPGKTPIRLKDGTNWWLQLVGRLKPGISPLQVRGNLEGAFQATAREGWASYLASLTPLEQALSLIRTTPQFRTLKWTLPAAEYTDRSEYAEVGLDSQRCRWSHA
jgi:hypothetical protein